MSARRVALVGGPADGTPYDVADDCHVLRVPVIVPGVPGISHAIYRRRWTNSLYFDYQPQPEPTT